MTPTPERPYRPGAFFVAPAQSAQEAQPAQLGQPTKKTWTTLSGGPRWRQGCLNPDMGEFFSFSNLTNLTTNMRMLIMPV